MKADSERTHTAQPGQSPDDRLGLVKELGVVVRQGLIPVRLLDYAQSIERLLALTSDSGCTTGIRLRQLVERITDAARALAHLQEGRAALALFGLAGVGIDAPLGTRRQAAADAWCAPGKTMQGDSFRRKEHELAVLHAILAQMSGSIMVEQPLDLQARVARTPWQLDRSSADLEPIWFSAHTVIGSGSRLPSHTDWIREFIAHESDIQQYVIRTAVDMPTRIIPLDEDSRVSGPFGLDRNGRLVWVIEFLPSAKGSRVRFSYRKEFLGPPNDPCTSGYLAYLARSDRPRESGVISAEFLGPETPTTTIRFITPGGTLPHLNGPTWPTRLHDRHIKAEFSTFTPRSSHGLYWCFEPDETFPC